jgi:peptidyl-prolyl cis-trans isomerase C
MMAKHVTFKAGLAFVAALGMAFPSFAQEAQAPAVDATTQDAAPKADANTIVATVNGTEITLGHMIVLRNNLPEQYQSLPDDVLFSGILEQLIQQTVLAQSIEPRITQADLLAIENDRRGYLSSIALAEVAGSAITDEALQKAYEARFSAELKEYNAAHILVATEDEAKTLKDEINGGADFAELAKVHSSDGASANGGDLGWFREGMMVKPFQDAVFAMEAGSVSDPVQTQFGWHLISLKEVRVAQSPALDEVRDELAAEIESAAVQDYIEKVVASATVDRPGATLDPTLLSDTTALNP